MWIRKREGIAFICHPRTASSATSHCLRENLHFVNEGNHHSVEPTDGYRVIGCTVRNVFDTLVSWHFYDKHSPLYGNFPEWVKFFLDNPIHFVKDGLFYGRHLATHVLRFEHLDADFARFLEIAGLDHYPIPRRNVSRRREGRPWQEFYTEELKQYVMEHPYITRK